MSEIKLNLGCGQTVIAGWDNVDYSLGARLARIPVLGWLVRRTKLFNVEWNSSIKLHDLRKPLPYPADSVDIIYTSHTLEHLSREDGRLLLESCNQVLKPGGVLRIVVPDLAEYVRRYQQGEIMAEDFIEDLGVLYGVGGKKGLKRLLAPFIEFPHRCMYDTPGLVRILRGIGFDANAREGFDSAIADIRSIEQASRVEKAVVVEAHKSGTGGRTI